MAGFDPDAYLQNKNDEFDPDAYLSGQQAQVAMPAQNEALQELAAKQSPMQAGLIATGKGMTDIGRYIGLVDDETKTEKAAFEALEQESPTATMIGETVGQSAPFLLPGLGQAGMAAKLGGGAIARGASAAGLGALEAGVISDINGGDVTTGALMGGGVAAGAELLFPKIGKAYRKLRGVEPSTKLVDAAGNISPSFEKALAKEGLTTGNLVEAVTADLPKIAAQSGESGRARLTEATAAQEAAKAVVRRQLQAGARDDSLAPLMIANGKVVDDSLAKEAVKQGFEKGTVQLAKTANKETQAEMAKGLKLAFDIQHQSRLAQSSRPSDFAGKALFDRVRHIKSTAGEAGQELDNIAKTQLKDMAFDHSTVNAAVYKIFDDLGIDDLNPGGVPAPNFKGSEITGDKSSQRAIKEVVRIASESKRGDALGAHMMKRQLDKLINYEKSKLTGLGADGEKAIRSVRRALNDGIRINSPDYARVNDTMSQAFDALDELQGAVGKSVNLKVDSANSALGTSIRGLFSNRAKRMELSDSFNKIDDAANALGGDFKTSYRDLSQFAREIENIFGQTAKTSLAGEIAGAGKSLARGDKLETLDKLGRAGMNKLKDINDYNAYKSMRDLLKRGGQ